ncbi:hypothetical protein M3936_00040 [Sutcliffiella horikoshii]|uniref:hypothetical protein n=1 Tax=Sutcliffiella horikoshii TaxID=79883 RepID=UPI00203B9B1C|nr:hypothetical protein [Sutcliffiella horikoshii]MCM3615957.1 hypothetical protein [Sutcliffiella horikoshii]
MTYNAKYPTVVHSFILSLMLVQGIYQLLHENYGRAVVQLSIAFIIAFSYFIRYQVRVNKTSIHYQVMFLHVVLTSKEISCMDISKIVFKQIGRSSRAAYIFTNKFLPVRLVNFKPESMYGELHSFGKNNLLTIVMKDDFLYKRQEISKES